MKKYVSERGMVAVWTAGALLAIFGFTALAVDVSGFFQQARSEQRAADLACLAGAQELPGNSDIAVDKVIEYLKPNQEGLGPLNAASPDSGTPGNGLATWSVGNFTIELETPYQGADTKMRVSILQSVPTTFGRAIGSEAVDVHQEAICEVGSALGSSADQPFGVLTGFTGGIINFGTNECTLNDDNNSQCSGLAIPRHDDPPGSADWPVHTTNNYITNMIAGINWDLEPSTPDVLCRLNGSVQPGDNEPCDRVATISGNDPSHVYNGLISGKASLGFAGDDIGYLEDPSSSYCHGSDCYDPHTLGDVAECLDPDGSGATGSEYCPTPKDSTEWTDPDDVPQATITKIKDCDCPRFSRIPVVDNFPSSSCTKPDPEDPDHLNKCTARVVGFDWVFLLRPYFNGEDPPGGPNADHNDFMSSGQRVRDIAAVKITLASDVDVEGRCFSEFTEGAPKAVRLITG